MNKRPLNYSSFLKETKERFDDALNEDDKRYYNTVLIYILKKTKKPVNKVKELNFILDRTIKSIENLKRKE